MTIARLAGLPFPRVVALPILILLGCTPRSAPTDHDTDARTDTGIDTDIDGVDTDRWDTDTDTGPPPECAPSSVPTSTVGEPRSCAFDELGAVSPPEVVWVANTARPDLHEVVIGGVLDTNGDGVIDGWDRPQIAAHAYDLTLHDSGSGEVLRTHERMLMTSALARGADGRTVRFGPIGQDHPGALQDLDSGSLIAYPTGSSDSYYSIFDFSVVDSAGDGKAEFAHGGHIWRADGSVVSRRRFEVEESTLAAVLDLDGSGDLTLLTDAAVLDLDGTVRCSLPGFDPVTTRAAFGEFDTTEPGAEFLALDNEQSAIFTAACKRLATGPKLVRWRDSETRDNTLVYVSPSPQIAIGPLADADAPFGWVGSGGWWVGDDIERGIIAFDANMNEIRRYSEPREGPLQPFTKPALADLDGDGRSEVLVVGLGDDQALVALDGATGDVIWRLDDRKYQGLAIADVDHDGHAEIAATGVRLDEEQGPIGEVVLLQGKGQEWAPAQSWWHQTNFVPLSVGADLRPISPELRGGFTDRMTLRSTLPAELVDGHGSSPAVRIVEVCDTECERGTLQVTVQVGNLGTRDLLLPVDLVIEGIIDKDVEELARLAIDGSLAAATWRDGMDLRISASLGVSDLTARLEPKGWTPLGVCDLDAMSHTLSSRWCD